MIKAKYFVEFEVLERQMVAPLQISREEYRNRLAYLKEQARIDRRGLPLDNEIEECETKIHDYGTTTQTVHTFRCGTAFVILTKIDAKDGYRLKTKKELSKQ